MKQVLLIGYPFPLRPGGSPRLLGLAKYLPEFGWQPAILTAPLDRRPDPRFRVVETGYRQTLGLFMKIFQLNANEDIRRQVKSRLGVASKSSWLDKLMTLAGEIINYPDAEKGWKNPAINVGRGLLRKEKFDAIISTSAPVTAHVIAHRLKLEAGLPWVADLRDLWTQNHNYSYGRIRKWFDTRLELKTLKSADALVTVSPPWAEKLGQLHRGKKVYAITNGFDPETLNVPPIALTEKFTITYTGLIYPGKQDPTALLEAVAELIKEKVIKPESIEIRFYGPKEIWLEGEIRRLGLSEVVRQYGPVPREIALQKQRQSQVLLLLNWDEPGETGTVPGKFFEYLAAMRPVLATGGDSSGVVYQILRATGAGWQVADTDELKSRLKGLYEEYVRQGRVASPTDELKIAGYSQRQMAARFMEILNGLTGGKPVSVIR